MASVFEKALRMGEGLLMRRLQRIVKSVNALADDYEALSDAELAGETEVLRERYRNGESLDDLLPEAFAAVREAARRTLGLRAFDVQIMGGAALHLGNIAEMRTGEGKTLVAVFPAYLNALAGEGVHVVTVNDFLASYQAELMGRVFRALGMSTGVVVGGQNPATRRAQYEADVTYGTNNEFGFDYLRDNMAAKPEDLVQRGHFFAVVDEVDSILIDEARTPLIVAGPAVGEAGEWFTVFAQVIATLNLGWDYEIDEAKRTVAMLEPGIDKVEAALGIDNLYGAEHSSLISYMMNAVKARALFKRDKDYVVLDGEVRIVDEHTGRLMAGRRYSEGLHQAIEAKEQVAVQPENQTYATVTLQNYFRLYKKLAGMTGTAETEAAEFMNTYRLGVVPIPTHRPVKRVDQPDLIYKNELVKFQRVVADIMERYRTGQPVLVGTVSVEKSEYLSRLLAQAGVPHAVLNAKEHAGEAAVVAQAGRLGAVTVATNMAGRGTDIMLGGNTEFLAVARMHERGLSATETPAEFEAAWGEQLAQVKAEVAAEAARVAEVGGLYVLGTERHESRRIDNQLRGRSGRQGDPGETRFYLSLEDELMRLFKSGVAGMLMNRGADDVALESKVVSRAVASAQGQMEARNAGVRKDVLKYDDVMNRQRLAIYADRHRILHGDDISDWVQKFLVQAVAQVVDLHVDAQQEVDVPELWTALDGLYPMTVTVDDIITERGAGKMTREFVLDELDADVKLAYGRAEVAVGAERMRELERQVVLAAVDRHWREHLYEMDYLKEGIGLRSMAQKDPLIEYQQEGYALFQTMMGHIRESVLRELFQAVATALQTPEAPEVPAAEGTEPPAGLMFSGPSEDDIT